MGLGSIFNKEASFTDVVKFSANKVVAPLKIAAQIATGGLLLGGHVGGALAMGAVAAGLGKLQDHAAQNGWDDIRLLDHNARRKIDNVVAETSMAALGVGAVTAGVGLLAVGGLQSLPYSVAIAGLGGMILKTQIDDVRYSLAEKREAAVSAVSTPKPKGAKL